MALHAGQHPYWSGFTAVDAVYPSDPQHGGLAIILWSRMQLPAVSTFVCLAILVDSGESSFVVLAVY